MCPSTGHKSHPGPGMGLFVLAVTFWCPLKPCASLSPIVPLSIASPFHLTWQWRCEASCPFRCDDTCGCGNNFHSSIQTNFMIWKRCQCQLALLTSPSVRNSWRLWNWHCSWTFTPLGSVISDCSTFLALKTQGSPRPYHSDPESHAVYMISSIHSLLVFYHCFTKSLILFSFRFLFGMLLRLHH